MLLNEFKESFKQFIEKDEMRLLSGACERHIEYLENGEPDEDEEQVKQRAKDRGLSPDRPYNFNFFLLELGIIFRLTCAYDVENKTINFISLEAKPKVDSSKTVREEVLTNE